LFEAVRDYGATIKLVGDTYDDAYAWAAARSTEKGIPLIHPYDDPLTIAGQGTIGLEILEQHPADIHAIFIPVGGGGLLAGIAAAVKATCPAVKIIGVEPDEAPCMTEALKRGRRITLKQVGIFADGVAVRQAGKETYRIAREHVDEMLTVTTDEICAAMKDIFDDCRSVVEPAGALAIARASKNMSNRPVCRVNPWWRSTAARISISIVSGTCPSARRSVNSGRHCWR
jgi:threonine dehydratase